MKWVRFSVHCFQFKAAVFTAFITQKAINAMEIRKGTRKDFPEITRMWLEFFPEDTAKVAREYLEERLGRGEILVMDSDGTVAGFLTFSKNYFFNSDYNQFVMVNGKFHRKGIATALMKEFESQAGRRKCRRVFSSSEPWNKASISMHRKLGYARCGYIDNMWGEGKRDLFFSKKLG